MEALKHIKEIKTRFVESVARGAATLEEFRHHPQATAEYLVGVLPSMGKAGRYYGFRRYGGGGGGGNNVGKAVIGAVIGLLFILTGYLVVIDIINNKTGDGKITGTDAFIWKSLSTFFALAGLAMVGALAWKAAK